LEQLLINTARQVSHNARLLDAAVSWLAQYGLLVARHRLASKIVSQERKVRAAMGLFLDAARGQGEGTAVDAVIDACEPAEVGQPLFDFDRKTPSLARFAREQASSVALRWNLWTDVEIRPKIIRPPGWVFGANPSFRTRAILGGGLRASALACLEWDASQGASEAELARLCRVTRKAMHEALDHLEFCQLIQRTRVGRCYLVKLVRRSDRAAV
jgi:hypothetical protein